MLWLVSLLFLSGASSYVQIQENGVKLPECAGTVCGPNSDCVVIREGDKVITRCVDRKELVVLRAFRNSKSTTEEIQLLHKTQQNVCNDHELNAMGGRILQWFNDVHLTVRGVDKSLKEHTLACRDDVAWMFLQWDGDDNGYLTKHEIIPILKGGQEKCIEQFFDRCDDINIDNQLSIDEWCDCFNFADNLRHEPPCHKAKHAVDPHVLGAFLPRCDLEGYYRPEQCHGGSCWCVDKYGREFDKSRVEKGLPDCGQYGSLTAVEKEELRARVEM
ncbi:unnamed protein product [Auanema sp. JU1783]|nr:unnamed protein product [Auanema sp. JU1783]